MITIVVLLYLQSCKYIMDRVPARTNTPIAFILHIGTGQGGECMTTTKHESSKTGDLSLNDIAMKHANLHQRSTCTPTIYYIIVSH